MNIKKVTEELASEVLRVAAGSLDLPEKCPECGEDFVEETFAVECTNCCEVFEHDRRIDRAIDTAFGDTVYGSEYFIYTKYEEIKDEIEEETRGKIEKLRYVRF